MIHPLSKATSPFLVLNGEEIAQPGIVDRITQATIHRNGQVSILTSLGIMQSTIHIPSGSCPEQYFRDVYWVACSILGNGGKQEYGLHYHQRGLGAGGGVSTGRPGAQPLKGDVLAYYEDLKEYWNKPPSLDSILLEVVRDLAHMKVVPTRHFKRREGTYTFNLTWVEMLLKAGCDPNMKTSNGESLLRIAGGISFLGISVNSEKQCIALMTTLIEYGADVTIMTEGKSILHYFPEEKRLHVLVIEKAKLKGVDLVALDRAEDEKREKIKAAEIENSWKAKVTATNAKGETGLEIAILQGESVKEIQPLFDHGADIHKGYPIHTFLQWFFSDEKKEKADLTVLNLLLSKHPDLNKKDPKGVHVLELACYRADIFSLLVRAGASFSEPSVAKAVVLTSIRLNTDEQILPLLNNAFQLAKALHYAFENQHDRFFQRLITSGVNVDYVDEENSETCLQRICKKNCASWVKSERIQMLLKLKADPSKISEETFQSFPNSIKLLFPERLKKDPVVRAQQEQLVSSVIAAIDFNVLETVKTMGQMHALQEIIRELIFSDYADRFITYILDRDVEHLDMAIAKGVKEALVQLLFSSPQKTLNKQTVEVAIDHTFEAWCAQKNAQNAQKDAIFKKELQAQKQIAELDAKYEKMRKNHEEMQHKYEDMQIRQEQMQAKHHAIQEDEQQKREALEKQVKEAKAWAAAASYDAQQTGNAIRRGYI